MAGRADANRRRNTFALDRAHKLGSTRGRPTGRGRRRATSRLSARHSPGRHTSHMAIAASEDLERLVRREHANPHSILGAHPTKGGAVVRAFRPAAASVKAVTADGETAELEQVHPGGIFEGVIDGAEVPLELQARGRLRRRRHGHDRRPVPLPAHHRGARPAPPRRGTPRGDVDQARRARAGDGRRARDGVRGLGAVGPRRVRGRRLQLLGRPRAPDARARGVRGLGALPARHRGRRALQVRDPRAGRRDPPEGRSGRLRHRGAAQDRVGRARVDARRGPTRSGWGTARSRTRSRARSRSTRSTSGRGG